MSYKQNIVVSNGPVQLVDKSKFGNSVSQGGVTCTNNGDGSWTINGNVTAENRFNLNFYQLGANVIPYWLSYMVPVEHNYYTQDCGYDKLGGWLFYYLEEGKNYENFKIYPQIISLTDTFGSGNEPKNKEQVKAKFPDDLYPYNPTNRVTTYKELIKVSDVCQLLDKSKYPATNTTHGITFTNNGDGTIITNGETSDKRASYFVNTVPATEGHIYLLTGVAGSTSKFFLNSFFATSTSWLKDNICRGGQDGIVFPYVTGATIIKTQIGIEPNATADNLVFKPQLFDLTEMFGAGNEPKTVAEFKQKFTDELYPYSPNCWITSYKNVSKVSDICQLLDKNTFYTISAEGTAATYNNDGTFTVSGTATADSWKNFPIFQLLPNGGKHVYLFNVNADSGTSDVYCNIYFYNEITAYAQELIAAGGNSKPAAGIITLNNTTIYQARFNITTLTGATPNNIIYKPQLFDLTEMYGAGNEPKTVAEFREKFPEELYDYSPRCII